MDLMDYTQLLLRFRKRRFDGLRKTAKIVAAGNQNVQGTAIPKLITHRNPETRTFILRYPHTKDFLPPVHIDTKNSIKTLIDNFRVFLNLVNYAVQEHDGIYSIKRSRLPFLHRRQHFVSDFANQRRRCVYPVNIAQMVFVDMPLAYIATILCSSPSGRF